MLAILAAALALATADPTLKTTQKPAVSNPVQGVCTVKFPTKEPVQAPCLIAAMSENGTTGVAFGFDGNGVISFVGLAGEQGVAVRVIVVGNTPYEAEGICVSETGQVTCVAAPIGSAEPLIVIAEF